MREMAKQPTIGVRRRLQPEIVIPCRPSNPQSTVPGNARENSCKEGSLLQEELKGSSLRQGRRIAVPDPCAPMGTEFGVSFGVSYIINYLWYQKFVHLVIVFPVTVR